MVARAPASATRKRSPADERAFARWFLDDAGQPTVISTRIRREVWRRYRLAADDVLQDVVIDILALMRRHPDALFPLPVAGTPLEEQPDYHVVFRYALRGVRRAIAAQAEAAGRLSVISLDAPLAGEEGEFEREVADASWPDVVELIALLPSMREAEEEADRLRVREAARRWALRQVRARMVLSMSAMPGGDAFLAYVDELIAAGPDAVEAEQAGGSRIAPSGNTLGAWAVALGKPQREGNRARDFGDRFIAIVWPVVEDDALADAIATRDPADPDHAYLQLLATHHARPLSGRRLAVPVDGPHPVTQLARARRLVWGELVARRAPWVTVAPPFALWPAGSEHAKFAEVPLP